MNTVEGTFGLLQDRSPCRCATVEQLVSEVGAADAMFVNVQVLNLETVGRPRQQFFRTPALPWPMSWNFKTTDIFVNRS